MTNIDGPTARNSHIVRPASTIQETIHLIGAPSIDASDYVFV